MKTLLARSPVRRGEWIGYFNSKLQVVGSNPTGGSMSP
jgi:hypothetical protein